MVSSLDAGAQTLVAGDIVILGISADSGPTPQGEFCWMPLINLNSGTVIYFTDAGWNDQDNAFMGAAAASESLIKYTVPAAGVLAGVPQVVSNWTATAPTNYQCVTGTKCGERAAGFNLPNSGDQIIVFTSTTATTSSSFGTLGFFTPIFAATTATLNWASATGNTASYNASSLRNNVSNLPDGLVDGSTAVAVGMGSLEADEADNIRYEANPASGSRAVLLSNIATRAKWGRYDGTAGAEFPDLTVGGVATGWTNKLAGNYSVTGSDNIKPVCQSITLVGSPAANATSVSFTVTFDETVSNVSTDDFTVSTATGNASGTVSGVSGSGTTYTVSVSTATNTAGSFRLNLNGNTNIVDAYGNGNGTNGTVAAFTTGATHTMDRINPTVTISSAQTSPTNVASITINISFSESVTGFDINDVVVGNGTKSNFSGSGNSYSLLVAPTADGAVTVSVAAGVAVDAASNNNNAATNFSITSDRTSPTVSISGASGTTNASSIPLTITFSESVTGFVVGDITVSGGTLNTFSGSGTTYTVNLAPTTNGTVAVNISGGVATDGPGNGNAAASQYSIVYDNIQPTVSISSATANPTNSNSIPVTVTFSESVANFIATDVTIGNGSLNSFSGSGTTYTFNVVPTANTTVTVAVNAGVANDAAGNTNTAATSLTRVHDSQQPTVSITSITSNPTNSTSIPVTVTFSESVSNFVSGDVTVGNGTLNTFSGSGTTYTFNIVPSANGPVTVDVNAGVANDAAGNLNTAATQLSRTFDNVQPGTSITSGAANPTNANIPVTVTFSESVVNFVSGDVSVGNGTLNSFSGSGTTYTFTIVPAANGAVTVNVGAGVANDAAGNVNTAATQLSRTFDNVQPTVSISSAAANPTNSGSIAVTVTFSESVANFISTDVVVGNGTLNTFSGSGTTYTFNIVPSANGTVTVNVGAGVADDAAGNTNTAATQFSIVYDNVQPTVSISSAAPNPTNANIPVTISFSESVANFVQGDITISNGSINSFSGSGSTYTFTVVPSANGTVTLDVSAGVANDAAGNTNTAATQLSRTFDNTQPTVSISSAVPNPTNSGSIAVTVTFSESVSNFIATDVTIGNGTLNSFSGSGTTYTFNIAPSANGTVTADIAAGVANDAAGNTNTAATQFSRVYDAVQPSVAITSPGTTNPTNANSFQVTVTFSESVVNFVSGDITVGNGSLSNFSGSGTTYTATVTPTADGTVTVNVSAGVANDAAGNGNTAASQYSVVSDKNGPAVTISSSANNPTNLSTIPLTFTFAESVTNFIATDIFVSSGTISGFSGSGTTYTANLIPSSDATINVFVFAGVANDAAGNGNTVGTFAITSDRTRPTVTISSPQSTPTSANPIVININFSEPVVNFIQTDITATGGTLSGFSGSGSSYSVNLTPTGNGNKVVNVAANVATDAAGNNNFAATQFSIFYITACSQPTVWNGLFWSGGNPVATQPAIINGDYDSASANPGGFSACSLIVGSGFNAIINSGDNITITGNVTVQSGATLTFENNANLIQSGSVTTGNSGNITIKRNATMIRQDYVYWSSPVVGQNLLAFSPATLPTRFYEISETTNAFVYVNPATNTFQAAKGYAIRAPDNYVPNTPTVFEGIFTGVPRKGDISIPITHNAQGYNLIGNPYPSPINADLFLAANPSIGTIYYWTHMQQSAPSGANYASYNATGAAAASNTVPASALPNGTIQTGQGFMALANAAGNAVFTNSMRVNNTDDQFYRASNNPEQKSRIWLNLSSSQGSINQMLLGYVAEATNDFDLRFDGKLVELQGTKLYSVINDSEYVIQGRALPFADTDVVRLGFRTDVAGTYTISLDHVDGLFSDAQDVFLKDNLTGAIHNIKLSDYNFAATAGTYHNRFEVVYQNSPLGTATPVLDSSQVVLYKDQGIVKINSGAIAMDNVKVFDIRGRLIYEKRNINASETALTDLNVDQEVLLVQITSTDGRMITKKAVN
ncbi:hypothetical protein HYN49_07615 [Flavobacterium pallidum]|uniref:Bacterial Ig-like domain-containing protein n=2 Tax=Flavobacterium pallidum TaxID=2172098 RepID=A0A2S1SH89_9FLAO|nr:hypothetical protein HYN49_07615 [Flavobacterium pallidum]